MKTKTNQEVGQEAYRSFAKYWEEMVKNTPGMDTSHKNMLNIGLLWFSAFCAGYDYCDNGSNVLDRLDLN